MSSPTEPKSTPEIGTIPKESMERPRPETLKDTVVAAPLVVTNFHYADKCDIRMTSASRLTVEWDNGKAYEATNGASVDYIAPNMFIHLDTNTKAYDIAADYYAMTTGGTNPKLAWVVCLIRRVAMSMAGIKVMASETVYTRNLVKDFDVDNSVVTMLTGKGPVVNAIAQQTFTILALNGQSLVSRGHHYSEDDAVWNRFVSATTFDTLFGQLQVQAWQGAIFHDALHPLDFDWVAHIVTDPGSNLRPKCNGVANTRMGTLPAGCTHLALVKPMREEVAARNNDLADLFLEIEHRIDSIIAKIRTRPLDFCTHFQRVGTQERLAEVKKFEPVVAFLYGYLLAAGAKKISVMTAKSLSGIKQRNGPQFAMGQTAIAGFAVKEYTKEEVTAYLNSILKTNIDAEVLNTKGDDGKAETM